MNCSLYMVTVSNYYAYARSSNWMQSQNQSLRCSSSSSKSFIFKSVCKVVETKLHSDSENGVGKLKLTESEANTHGTHSTRGQLSHVHQILTES